ncbi:MAG: DUF992 domain-containing protein [Chromatiales bacterium]|jgi:hypothetical protein|nr:DUF992 domain-containing protein [Chromatiales bacterium]
MWRRARAICRLAILLIGSLAVTTAHAQSNESTRIGVLSCESIPGTRLNLIFRSTTDVHCEFRDASGKVDYYLGETGIAFGADLTFAKDEETFAFAVISASSIKIGEHTLAGKYIGGKASASLGVGVGAAILVGGDYDNFSLQPIAIEGNSGFGAAVGLGFLYIEKAR